MGTVDLKNNIRGYLMIYILLIGPVILVSPSKEEVKDCGDVSTEECLGKLQTFLKLKSLPFTKDVHKLNKLCSETVAGYNCSSRKMVGPNCLSNMDKETIPVFIQMAQYTMFMFCSYNQGKGYLGEGQLGYLREDLLDHSECILRHQESLECCAKETNLMDLPVMHILDQSSRSIAERQVAACCPVANYLRCVRGIIHDTCGEIAGNLTVEYIRRASGERLESVCQKLPDYPEPSEEFCKTSPFVCAGCETRRFMGLTALLFILFAVFISPL